MAIDWVHFTPFSALAGGAMLGVAASLLILGAGRILGAAGILGGALELGDSETPWRWWLIVGLLGAPFVARATWGAGAPVLRRRRANAVHRLGSARRLRNAAGAGCTSGHGVCGLARLSPRSLVATLVFMSAGFATVFLVRHVIG